MVEVEEDGDTAGSEVNVVADDIVVDTGVIDGIMASVCRCSTPSVPALDCGMDSFDAGASLLSSLPLSMTLCSSWVSLSGMKSR